MKFIEFARYDGGEIVALNVDRITYLSAPESGGETSIFVDGVAEPLQVARSIKEVLEWISKAEKV